jgi:hypothetical protein
MEVPGSLQIQERFELAIIVVRPVGDLNAKYLMSRPRPFMTVEV